MANNMKCPNCSHSGNKVTNSGSGDNPRYSAMLKIKELNTIYRTRQCRHCKTDFRTLEFMVPEEDIKDGDQIKRRAGRVLGSLVSVKHRTAKIMEETMNIMNQLMQPYHKNLEMAKESGDKVWIEQAYAAKREALNGFISGKEHTNGTVPHMKFRNQF